MKNLFFSKNEKDISIQKQTLTIIEKEELKQAKILLENPSFTIKLANYVGKPIEIGLEKIDSKIITKATEKALKASLNIAITSLGNQKKSTVSNTKHKVGTTLSGGIGGFFGLPALAIELPISTTIMLRSIADIANHEGHNLTHIETQLACLEVFSLGSNKTTSDDGSESAYFTARGALAIEMKLALNAVSHMSEKAIQEALAKGQLPILIKFINSIASRFGITVSEKLVAQSIPLIGAIGGASLNLMFMNHYQSMAQGHFVVKRLEKKYGQDEVHRVYELLNIEKIKG